MQKEMNENEITRVPVKKSNKTLIIVLIIMLIILIFFFLIAYLDYLPIDSDTDTLFSDEKSDPVFNASETDTVVPTPSINDTVSSSGGDDGSSDSVGSSSGDGGSSGGGGGEACIDECSSEGLFCDGNMTYNCTEASDSCFDRTNLTECGSGEQCVGGICEIIPDCVSDGDCVNFTYTCSVGICNATGRCEISYNVSDLCRASAGECDAVEYCSGSEVGCSADVFELDGTACSLGVCDSGVCVVECMTDEDCHEGILCTVDSCNELTRVCERNSIDAFCDDFVACTNDVCNILIGCENNANDGNCELWEFCSPVLDCQEKTACYGTDTDCGVYPDCENCNRLDGCYVTEYRDYYCNGTGCNYEVQTTIENLANGNCNNSIDDDCDGSIDEDDDCLGLGVCGDNFTVEGEACDGPDFNDKTCLDFGYNYGILSCCPDCQNFSLCQCYNATYGTCFDGDNGENYYILSNVTQSVSLNQGAPCPNETCGGWGGPMGFTPDFCNGDILSEGICNATTGMLQIVEYNCSLEGRECINGTCINIGTYISSTKPLSLWDGLIEWFNELYMAGLGNYSLFFF